MSALVDGVFYERSDYAGIGRRLLVLMIDGVVTIMLFCIALISFTSLAPDSRGVFHVHMFLFACAAFLYLAVLARSSWGTLGYKLTGVRVVDLGGEVPSLGSMTYRTLFAVLGPLNGVLDIMWLGGDPNRQSFRDKLAGTYVVRRSAVPIGRGRVRRVTLSVLGYTLTVNEVGRDVT